MLNIGFVTIRFTKKGCEFIHWLRGRTWGLRLYKDGYNHGLTFHFKLKIEPVHQQPLGPNTILAPSHIPKPTSDPQMSVVINTPMQPNTHAQQSWMITTLYNPMASCPITPVAHWSDNLLLGIIVQLFSVLNASKPDLTMACWLCYDTAPTYYESVATVGTFS